MLLNLEASTAQLLSDGRGHGLTRQAARRGDIDVDVRASTNEMDVHVSITSNVKHVRANSIRCAFDALIYALCQKPGGHKIDNLLLVTFLRVSQLLYLRHRKFLGLLECEKGRHRQRIRKKRQGKHKGAPKEYMSK